LKTPHNIAYGLQPEQTDALVLGFAKFLFGHGSCKKKQEPRPLKNFPYAFTLCDILGSGLFFEGTIAGTLGYKFPRPRVSERLF